MEKIQRKHPALQAGTPKNLIFNRQARRKSEEQFLPIPDPAALELAWRHWDDLSERAPVGGFPPDLIAVCGYKFAVNGCTSPVTIPRRTIVIPVRNTTGQIVALQGSKGKWFTARQLHFVNLIRCRWTQELEVFADTVTADVEAVSRNVACASLNGLTLHDLELATANLNVRVVVKNGWRVAA